MCETLYMRIPNPKTRMDHEGVLMNAENRNDMQGGFKAIVEYGTKYLKERSRIR